VVRTGDVEKMSRRSRLGDRNSDQRAREGEVVYIRPRLCPLWEGGKGGGRYFPRGSHPNRVKTASRRERKSKTRGIERPAYD